MAQNTITQVIDDRGPGIAFFSSSASWNRESNPLEFDQTATWTETAGDSVTVSFNGTYIHCNVVRDVVELYTRNVHYCLLHAGQYGFPTRPSIIPSGQCPHYPSDKLVIFGRNPVPTNVLPISCAQLGGSHPHYNQPRQWVYFPF